MKHASVKQTAKLYDGTFTENSLRHLLYMRKNNGLDECVVKLGKKILIDLEAFEIWLDKFKLSNINLKKR